ncbi:MAG: GAF domain-containing protein [Deltaproteobacteria bacterium]|nr:GAF domain-containing protein [Deltaproteobacteria bacterium]
MPHEAASNLNKPLSEDDFEILGQVFLDPLLKHRPLFWIGIYERLDQEAVRRVFRGPYPPCHTFSFGKGNVGFVAEAGIRKVIPDVTTDLQYSQCFIETQSEWVEPIRFDGASVGVIDIEEDKKNAFSDADEKDFKNLSEQIAPLLAWKEVSWTARLKILKKLFRLRERHKDFNWIGIYRRETNRNDSLLLSIFLGPPTDHFRIPISKGICGAAVREDRTLNIPNVQSDPRHIACSLSTQSELVVPIRNSENKVIAEIDIDSDKPDAFTPERVAEVEAAAIEISKILEFNL